MGIFIGLAFIVMCITKTTACPNVGCYGTIQSHKYFIEPQSKYNFFEAVSECTRRNMTLVTIDSEEKALEVNNLLSMIFGENPIPRLFIGAFSWENFQFVWISSGKPLDFTNWYMGEPNLEIEKCVQLGRYKRGMWNNVQCATKIGYICE